MLHVNNSYAEKYKRCRGIKQSDLEKQRLLTDRSAYMTFLESQLERVSASCLTVVGFQTRLESLQSQVIRMEKQLVNHTQRIDMNAAKEIKHVDPEPNEALKDRVEKLEQLVQDMALKIGNDARVIQNLEMRIKKQEVAISTSNAVKDNNEDTQPNLPSKHQGLDRIENLVRQMADDRSKDVQAMRNLTKRVSECEIVARAAAQSAAKTAPKPAAKPTSIPKAKSKAKSTAKSAHSSSGGKIFATREMVRKMEEKYDKKIAQLSSTLPGKKELKAMLVCPNKDLHEDFMSLEKLISRRYEECENALKKHAKCIVDQRAAINLLAKDHASGLSGCRSTLENLINDLSRRVNQHSTLLSEKDAREHESRITAQLDSKMQKIFLSLQDGLLKESLQKHTDLIEDCIRRIKSQDEQNAKHIQILTSESEYSRQQTKTLTAKQDLYEKQLESYAKRLLIVEQISVTSKCTLERVLSLVESQQISHQLNTERLVKESFSLYNTHNTTKNIQDERNQFDGQHSRRNLREEVSQEVELLRQRLQTAMTTKIDQYMRDKVQCIPKANLDSHVAQILDSHVRSTLHISVDNMKACLEQNLKDDMNRMFESLKSELRQSQILLEPDSIPKSMYDLKESLNSLKTATTSAIEDVGDSMAIEIAKLRKDLRKELDNIIKNKFAKESKSFDAYLQKAANQYCTEDELRSQKKKFIVRQKLAERSSTLSKTQALVRLHEEREDGDTEEPTGIGQSFAGSKNGISELSRDTTKTPIRGKDGFQIFAERQKKYAVRSKIVCDELRELQNDLRKASVHLEDNHYSGIKEIINLNENSDISDSLFVSQSVCDSNRQKENFNNQVDAICNDIIGWKSGETALNRGLEYGANMSNEKCPENRSPQGTTMLKLKRKRKRKKKRKKKLDLAKSNRVERGGGGALTFCPARIAKMKRVWMRK